jgi:hypothetical protein
MFICIRVCRLKTEEWRGEECVYLFFSLGANNRNGGREEGRQRVVIDNETLSGGNARKEKKIEELTIHH